ncbi:MarR family winged helix-turn-helix transcriptional regulator [Thauera sinica]|uniref:MarR family winged helix-turn-helix transcriptional regulator n=1 Tax=Thauera sinica TaxID=2665146 RepID=A0ABW1ARU3_9RHOO|nr:MarR family transcriptional regulator [Thauera sp. K11]ATE62188.1 MarR family transcriptional regulator [Thauera sp. K11]
MKKNEAPYLTYKLDLIKTILMKLGNAHYKKALDLGVRELRVLRLVHDFPGITATDLGNRLVLDKTLLSKNISYLEGRGLISRCANAQDNRQQCLTLTEAGMRAWYEGERIGRGLEAELFADFSDQEWTRLHGMLDQLLASIENWKQRDRQK